MEWKHTLLAAVIMLSLLLSWIARYEIISVPVGAEGIIGLVYRLDHWTGNIVVINGTQVLHVQIK